jgi:hypothetical protein
MINEKLIPKVRLKNTLSFMWYKFSVPKKEMLGKNGLFISPEYIRGRKGECDLIIAKDYNYNTIFKHMEADKRIEPYYHWYMTYQRAYSTYPHKHHFTAYIKYLRDSVFGKHKEFISSIMLRDEKQNEIALATLNKDNMIKGV